MLLIQSVLGHHDDAAFHDRLHELEHDGLVEFVEISTTDAARHRLRVTTDRGTDLAISLDRDVQLRDGAVLLFDIDRAIVVRVGETAWLMLTPSDIGAALELGHRAGHLHWRVRFNGDVLLVAIEGLRGDLVARIADLVDTGRVLVT